MTLSAVASSVPQADVRARVASLLRESTARGLSPVAVAWALRTASHVEANRRREQSVEIVWTGPTHGGSTFRRTDQALLDLIGVSRRTVTIVTYAAYKVPEIVEALRAAITRSVEVSLIIESPEDEGGKATFSAAEAFSGLARHQVGLYVWPPDERPRDPSGRHGSLHVKCAIADESQALISSANLTGFALNLNMELGVLIRGGPVPRELHRHFAALVASGTLRALS